MDLSALNTLDAEALRSLLPAFVAAHVEAPADEGAGDAARAAIADAPDAVLLEMVRQLVTLGDDYAAYPAHPLARALGRATMAALMQGSRAVGLEQLAPGPGRGEVWLCNHLSYVDTQATDQLLWQAGRADRADGLIAVAGPKVYAEPFRRMAALSLNTLKTVQSDRIGTNEAQLGPRELAKIAVESVQQARSWREERGPILLYPEGTRSRNGRMGPWLRGVERYLRGAARIVPVAVIDTDRLFSFRERLVPAVVELRVGQPFAPEEAGPGRDDALLLARARISALLPPERQPEGEPLV